MFSNIINSINYYRLKRLHRKNTAMLDRFLLLLDNISPGIEESIKNKEDCTDLLVYTEGVTGKFVDEVQETINKCKIWGYNTYEFEETRIRVLEINSRMRKFIAMIGKEDND